MTKIIGISGISGAGTTTLTKALGTALNATTIFWDDFDDISESHDDLVEWFKSSKDYGAWHYPALEETLKTLKAGLSMKHPASGQDLPPSSVVIFDAPLGRMHRATGQYIDLLIHLDTSMDVALSRRVLRDYREKPKEIIDDLEWYLADGRPLFDASETKKTADLVLNGDLPIAQLVKSALPHLV